MKIPVAIIGAGYLGSLHAKKIAQIENAQLSFVVDPLIEKARSLAKLYNSNAFASLSEALINYENHEIQAAIVASPTETHFEIAKQLLQKKFHLLIEKPCTIHANLAQNLVALANEQYLLFRIGYLEALSPALKNMNEANAIPYYMTSERLGPFSGRSLDINVIKDLMVHDLYHALSFGLQNVTDIHAIGIPVITQGIDIANVRIEFSNGSVANFTASRVSLESSRKIRIFTSKGYYSIDLKTHTAKHVFQQENTAEVFPFSLNHQEYSSVDLLKIQDTQFIDDLYHACFLQKQHEYKIHQDNSIRVLQLTEEIMKKIKSPLTLHGSNIEQHW